MSIMRWFARLSLKNKIVFSFLAVIMAVSVAIALLSRSILLTSLTEELEERGVAIASSIAERGGSFILDDRSPELLSLIYHEATSGTRKSLVSYIYVIGRDGQILSHTLVRRLPKDILGVNPLKPHQDRSSRLIEFEGEPVLDTVVPVKEGLHNIGAVHVGVKQDRVFDLVDKLRMTFVAYISVIFFIVWFISERVSRGITRPLSRLTRISDELSRGHFDIPIDISGEDEALDGAGCPAFANSEIFCWHYENASETEGAASEDKGFKKAAPRGKLCQKCVFERKQTGDEVEQLAASFRNMVWSIKLYRKKLRESEIKYRSLFDSGPEPIFVIDAQTLEILDANPRAEDLYGYRREDLLGRSFSELDRDGVVDLASVAGLGPNEDPSGAFLSKAVQYAKGGATFYANISASPLSYGERPSVVVAVADVTEMVDMDAQLVQASKMKSLGEMSAGIAHEVNQPLNAIKMGSEYLLMLGEGEVNVNAEDFKEAVREISAQVDRAAEIIQTLRSFGRKADHDKIATDLNASVGSVLTMVRKQMELDDIDFRLELAPDLPRIMAQDNRLQQVFFNLLTNARDAINETASGERSIVLRTRREGARVVAEVEDTGGGIPEAMSGKIFEPFFTTKEAGQGMGLGLSIIYGIVKDNGGDIRVGRGDGGGALFSVSFPAAS